jgi:hypothetical protein
MSKVAFIRVDDDENFFLDQAFSSLHYTFLVAFGRIAQSSPSSIGISGELSCYLMSKFDHHQARMESIDRIHIAWSSTLFGSVYFCFLR